MKRLLFTLLVATVLWTVMFCPLTAPHINFWYMMVASAGVLACMAMFFAPGLWRKLRVTPADLFWGVVIAVALWLLFWVGDKLSQLMFDFARPQVDTIYGMKDGESPLLLTLLMLFIIGPAEEIFWRGYVQQALSSRFNANVGFVLATLVYALVHAGSCNFMLTMAALVAGFVWGAIYRFFPGRLAALVISHALWDVAVFIWFPIM